MLLERQTHADGMTTMSYLRRQFRTITTATLNNERNIQRLTLSRPVPDDYTAAWHAPYEVTGGFLEPGSRSPVSRQLDWALAGSSWQACTWLGALYATKVAAVLRARGSDAFGYWLF